MHQQAVNSMRTTIAPGFWLAASLLVSMLAVAALHDEPAERRSLGTLYAVGPFLHAQTCVAIVWLFFGAGSLLVRLAMGISSFLVWLTFLGPHLHVNALANCLLLVAGLIALLAAGFRSYDRTGIGYWRRGRTFRITVREIIVVTGIASAGMLAGRVLMEQGNLRWWWPTPHEIARRLSLGMPKGDRVGMLIAIQALGYVVMLLVQLRPSGLKGVRLLGMAAVYLATALWARALLFPQPLRGFLLFDDPIYDLLLMFWMLSGLLVIRDSGLLLLPVWNEVVQGGFPRPGKSPLKTGNPPRRS